MSQRQVSPQTVSLPYTLQCIDNSVLLALLSCHASKFTRACLFFLEYIYTTGVSSACGEGLEQRTKTQQKDLWLSWTFQTELHAKVRAIALKTARCLPYE